MSEARLIARRYRVVRPLGRGGNAQVYEAHDETNDHRVALKQLRSDDAVRDHARDLFQREFNTLSELAHPLIVRVFDYGVDEDTPYYTMELLSGQSLRGRFPWREACSLLRDVASALSLVHSRRLVHRDVTHRNVYKTDDGHAKLFDFGALAPVGRTSDVVGTPAFMPPEAVAEQWLDPRSDLFSLGALGYLLLTERHAYPARRVADLGEAWRRPVEAPSRFVPDVPPALDELILSLLSVNAVARPASAAEVFSRLTAIASLSAAEAPEVARAYLTTPALIGRSDATRHFRENLSRTRQRRSTPIVVEGESGVGRSRALSSFLLEAKLDGFLVLRADAAGDGEETFAVARSLVRRLFARDPVLARDAAGAQAELISPLLFDEGASMVRERGRSAALVEALCSMFTAAAETRPIVIGVDDFELLDAYSKQFVVRLASGSKKSGLVLVVALLRSERTEAHALLRDVAGGIALGPLSPHETRKLVCSLFGEVANADIVSGWIHSLSGGRPREAMEAANHLVDSGVVRFEEGLWVLPPRLDGLNLPSSVDQALDARIALLESDARRLCQALALSSEQDPLLAREYPGLVPGLAGARLDAALNELAARSVLAQTSTGFVFSHAGMREAARRSIPPSELVDVHLRVARAYDSDPSPSYALSAHHFLQAGEVATAFERAARAVHERKKITVRGTAFLRTTAGIRSMETLFEWGVANHRCWQDVLPIGKLLLQLAAVADLGLARHRHVVVERLRVDSGLDDYDALPEITCPLERIQTAVGRAYARYATAPEHERGLDPGSAIASLCTVAAALSGVFARRSEPREAERLLVLIEPFRHLAPAAAVVADSIAITIDAILSRSVRERRLALLKTLSAPVFGLDEVVRVGSYWLNLYYEALDQACWGRPGAVELLEPLLQDATYTPLVWEVKLVAALFVGDMEGAEAARRERDLLRLPHTANIGTPMDGGLLYELAAFDQLGDVLRLKPFLDWYEKRSWVCPNMRAGYELHLGNYHRLRGELAKAAAAYRRGLALAPRADDAGEWALLVHHLGQVLVETGSAGEARELCSRAVVEAAEGQSFLGLQLLIELVLAMAEAALGRAREAVARTEHVIRAAEENQIGGIFFVNLCRHWARVAELLGDEEFLERAIVRLEALAARGRHTTFAAKHAHLLRLAQGRGRFQVAPVSATILGGNTATHTSVVSGVRTQIELCRGRGERARRALKILLDVAKGEEGYFYLCESEGVTLVASSTDAAPPPSLEALVSERLRAGTAEGDTTGEGESERLLSLRPAGLSDQYDVVEVMTQRNGQCVLAALAALKPREQGLEPVPMQVREALSDALLTAGDAPGIPWV